MLSLRAVAGLWSRRHNQVARVFVDWAEAQLEPPVFVKFEESGADRPALLSVWRPSRPQAAKA